MGGFKEKKIQKFYDVAYVLKPTKVKIKTNKIIVIAVTWEFGTLGDAPTHGSHVSFYNLLWVMHLYAWQPCVLL